MARRNLLTLLALLPTGRAHSDCSFRVLEEHEVLPRFRGKGEGRPGRQLQAAASDCAFASTAVPRDEYLPTCNARYTIKTVFHITHDGATGYYSESDVHGFMDSLNKAFNGTGRQYESTVAPEGTDTGIVFELADTDPSGAATGGITWHDDAAWFTTEPLDPAGSNGCTNNVCEARWDSTRYLNVYVLTLAPKSGTNQIGYAFLPSQAAGGTYDGIWLTTESVYLQSAATLPTTLIHEARPASAPAAPSYLSTALSPPTAPPPPVQAGHYLELHHTWDDSGECDGAATSGADDCHAVGDKICDTEPQAHAAYRQHARRSHRQQQLAGASLSRRAPRGAERVDGLDRLELRGRGHLVQHARPGAVDAACILPAQPHEPSTRTSSLPRVLRATLSRVGDPGAQHHERRHAARLPRQLHN